MAIPTYSRSKNTGFWGDETPVVVVINAIINAIDPQNAYHCALDRVAQAIRRRNRSISSGFARSEEVKTGKKENSEKLQL
jgi:hypothetical protein